MLPRVNRHAGLLLLLVGCDAAPSPPPSRPGLTAELAAPTNPPPANELRTGREQGAGLPDARLPIVGDPLGLLSRGTPTPAPAKTRREAQSELLDPGALMNPGAARSVDLARDPRAVARGQQPLPEQSRRTAVTAPDATAVPAQERSIGQVLTRIRNGAARPHVLMLYASYCKACRSVMPDFVQLAESYKRRGVSFTAASVDSDLSEFEAYAGVLRGVLDPLWIKSEGTTRRELQQAGLTFDGDKFSIPMFAVFNAARKPVAQGHSRELRTLPTLLDGML